MPLNISQSAVTTAIKDLESAIDGSLFAGGGLWQSGGLASVSRYRP